MSCWPRHSLSLCIALAGLFFPLPESARPVIMRPVKIGVVVLFLLLVALGIVEK